MTSLSAQLELTQRSVSAFIVETLFAHFGTPAACAACDTLTFTAILV